MKKIFIFVLCLVTLFAVTACGKIENKNEDDYDKMSREDIIDKLYSINNDLTKLWNESITNIRDYAETGKSNIGQELDIDFVISNMDSLYNKCLSNQNFVDNLDDEYSQFITAYDKAMEQAKIIYDSAKENTPVANQQLAYKSNIELFSQYQLKFYDLVNEVYFE